MKMKTLIGFFESIKSKQSAPRANTSFSFEIKSWGNDLQNISKWQKENARDQWSNAKYSSKKLYQYSWVNTTGRIKFVPEPKNEYDKFAIVVYLDNYKIGYIPKPINEQHYKKLLNCKNIEVDIHGGSSKYIDEYGDLIVNKGEPVVKVTVSI